MDRNYTTNGLNQYTVAGPASFTYDADGNLTSTPVQGGTMTYTYDAENRLTSTTLNGQTVSLEYDPLGRLYEVADPSTGTKRFVYDGDNLTLAYNTSGSVLGRYVFDPT